ncbi:DUF6233 domain-containing protein [Streptomyces pseudovenezuelae]|uniref:DUF6233 domain-containing protein n=1 Tax=Streptomyces pseudovenezuelae TaxID=67350 RepID=UPI0036E91C60
MNDPGMSRLAMLRFLERVQERDLARTRRWIAQEEQRETERQRGLAARSPAPDWLIERHRPQRDAVYVHVGGCWNAGSRSKGVERDQALRALAEGVDACPQCWPDTALGILD